ncbi:MAG: tlde1 domain-containing protein [Terriglobia bacterium]
MPWTYSQSNGALLSPDGTFYTGNYSGHGDGVNNCKMERVRNVGPIPTGIWLIGDAFDSPKTGKVTMALSPDHTTETFGRFGFMIHGDEVKHPGEELASEGCIVASLSVREAIAQSADRVLCVTQLIVKPEEPIASIKT